MTPEKRIKVGATRGLNTGFKRDMHNEMEQGYIFVRPGEDFPVTIEGWQGYGIARDGANLTTPGVTARVSMTLTQAEELRDLLDQAIDEYRRWGR